jgi:hypothetical protein
LEVTPACTSGLPSQATANIVNVSTQIDEITERNHPDILACFPAESPDLTDMLVHVLTDLHQALSMLAEQGRLQAEHDKLLQEYRPLLDRFAHPLASKLTGGRRAR